MSSTAPGDAVERVRAALDRHLAAGARAMVALSGGPDSGALAWLAARARPDLTLVGVHVRHGLRDDAADAAAARAVAGRLDMDCDVRAVEVAARGAGPEAAARDARYAALRAAAADHRAAAVLVGHTADDQAETVLLRLARGSGSRGLAGMAEARALGPAGPVLVRPLLAVRRAAAHAVVRAEDLPWVSDPTNTDADQRRARARAHVLPALGLLAGGPSDPVPLLCRTAELARADADALDALAGEVVAREVRRWGPGRAVRLDVLLPLPRALADRVVRAVLQPAIGGLPSAAAVATARELTERPAGAAQRMAHVAGGACVSVGGGWLAAAPLSAAVRERAVRPAPGAVPIEELGLLLRLEPGAGGRGGPPAMPAMPAVPAMPAGAAVPRAGGGHRPLPPGLAPASPHAPPEALPLAGIEHSLVLRGPRPGDRLQRGGRPRRVAELLAGVPRALRPLVPVLAEDGGAVRWVAGVGAAGATPAAGAAVAVVPHLEPLR